MKKAMKKAMKTMKKAKKSTMKRKKKAKRVSKIARGKRAKSAVFKGKKEKTLSGLKKENLTKNKSGKVVSKKKSDRGRHNKWTAAVARARKELKLKGFVAVGGKSALGRSLLAKARSLYKK